MAIGYVKSLINMIFSVLCRSGTERDGKESRGGGVTMDLGEAAKTTQWASESWNLRSRFTHHTHTHTPNTHPTEPAPTRWWEAQRLTQWSLDSATSWSKQEERS